MRVHIIDTDKEVVFYPYRTATVCGTLMELRCETAEDQKKYDKLLARLCRSAKRKFSYGNGIVAVNGVEVDNHVCFKVGKNFIMFSDCEIRVGSDIQINW